MNGGLYPSIDSLLLTAIFLYVQPYDFGTMERFFGVFEPDRQVVGRIFLQQQPKGVMTLVDGEADLRPAFHDDTFVTGGELVRDNMCTPYHTKGGFGLPANSVEFLPFGGTMEVDAVLTVPYVIDWDTVWTAFGIDERKYSILTTLQQGSCLRLIEQAILSPD